MISYLGSLVQFSPAAGSAGHCRQTSLCVGSTRRVPATLGLPRTGVSVLSPSTLLRLLAALYGAGPALSAVPVFGYSTIARVRLCLRFVPSPPERLRPPGACRARSPRVLRAFSPPRPQPRFPPMQVGCVRLVFSCEPPGGCRPSRISGCLWLETGGLLQFADGRGAVSGAEFAPVPSLLPPASAGLGGSSAG